MAANEYDPAARAREVLWAFLKLGLTSFGGPVAHIGYFRAEFVIRRQWLDDATFADMLSLCQFLPGPASSQLGFSIGLRRAGYAGALAAWTGFTLPSAAALVLVAYGWSAAGPLAHGVIHGLALVAVAIVAQAVAAMARTLCPDRPRAALGIVAAVVMSIAGSALMQVAVLAGGGLAGYGWWRRTSGTRPASGLPRLEVPSGPPASRQAGNVALLAFFGLLFFLPLLHGGSAAARFYAFYRAGALVLGGGHVVLPLLRDAFVRPGWVADDVFLAGYGAAQAVPGPLFTFAAYLGAVAAPAAERLTGAAIGLIGIFLPGMLVLTGTLPHWQRLRSAPAAQAAMRGVNAAVVGLLAAALYDPIWTGSVHSGADFSVALVGFAALSVLRVPPWVVVACGAASGAALTS